MPEFALLGAMDDKTSPILNGAEGLVQHLCLNGEMTRPGWYEKRRGLSTSVTVGQTFGSSAPFQIFRWTVDSTHSAIVCVGSDAIAFMNPSNGYLYVRTSGTAKIYSDPTNFATTVDTEWGLAEPGAVKTSQSLAGSRMNPGLYVYAISNYDSARRVESPCSLGLTSGDVGYATDKLQYVPSKAYQVEFKNLAAPDANASHVRVYRNRIAHFPSSGSGLQEVQADKSQYRGLRLIQEKAKDTPHVFDNDIGGQPTGALLTFAHTTVPFCKAVIRFDGRWFYGANPSLPYRVIFSNPDCPETYAANTTFGSGGPAVTPTIGELAEDDLVPGEAIIDLPTAVGEIIAFASAGDQLLVLCQYGSWRIQRVGDFGYGYARDPLSLGCVSRATVADSPYGTWWLAREGVVLWDGQSVPELVLRSRLNTAASETLFHGTFSSLAAACGAYSTRRSQYVVCVPQASSGQFLLCVQADMPLRNGYAYQKWTTALTITGMGSDPTTGEIVYRVGASTFYSATDGSYQDKTSTLVSYAWGLDAWWARGGKDGYVSSNVVVNLMCYRSDVGNTQTVSVTVRGAPIPDESAGTSPGAHTLTLAANKRELVGTEQGVAGEAIHVSIRNTDAYHLAMLSLSFDPPGTRRAY